MEEMEGLADEEMRGDIAENAAAAAARIEDADEGQRAGLAR